MLENQGHTVAIAADGESALAILDQESYAGFDCVLMDIQMPGVDGFECVAIIRDREPPGSRLPIVAMTWHPVKEDEARCIAAGMDALVSKPVKANELHEVVEAQLAGPPVPPAGASLPARRE
jgi:two-component system sensor histidine kinase/response regulator